jgi:hypothetical protein
VAISLVQATSATGTTASLTLTFGSATTAGNAVIVCWGFFGSTGQATAVSAKIGGNADHFTAELNMSGFEAGLLVDYNIGQSSTSVVITWTGSSGNLVTVGYAYEVSGLVTTSSIVDQTINTEASSLSWTSGTSSTTTQANEFWVGYGSSVATASQTVTGPTSPWNNEAVTHGSNSGQLINAISGYQIVSSTGTVTYSGSVTGTTEGTACFAASFFGAAATVTGTFSLALAPLKLSWAGSINSGNVTGTFSLALAPLKLNFLATPPLVLSIASTAGTDDYGNQFYGNGLGVYSASGQSVFLGVSGTLATEKFPTGQAIEDVAANIGVGSVGSGTSQYLTESIAGPQITAYPDWAQILMFSSPDGGPAAASGNLVYIDTSGTPHTIVQWTAHGLTIFNSTTPTSNSNGPSVYGGGNHLKYASSDGNNYNTGRWSGFVGVDTTFTTTSGTAVPNLDVPVAIGTYHITGHLVLRGVAASAGNALFNFTGPTITNMRLTALNYTISTTATVAAYESTSLGGTFGSIALSTTTDQVIDFDAHILFSAAGTLTLQASLGTSGDTFKVWGIDSWMEVFPVT